MSTFSIFFPRSIIRSPLLNPDEKLKDENSSLLIFFCSYHCPHMPQYSSSLRLLCSVKCSPQMLCGKFCPQFVALCSILQDTTATTGFEVASKKPRPGYTINFMITKARAMFTIQLNMLFSSHINCQAFLRRFPIAQWLLKR